MDDDWLFERAKDLKIVECGKHGARTVSKMDHQDMKFLRVLDIQSKRFYRD